MSRPKLLDARGFVEELAADRCIRCGKPVIGPFAEYAEVLTCSADCGAFSSPHPEIRRAELTVSLAKKASLYKQLLEAARATKPVHENETSHEKALRLIRAGVNEAVA